jgi:hypothetical protein
MILNHTIFHAEVNAGWDQTLMPYYAIVISAVFEAKPGAAVLPVVTYAASHQADIYFGEPGRSSVRYEADIAPEKPKVDVLVNGHVYAPRNRKAERVEVSLKVGDIFKQLVVTGDRTRRGLFGIASKPRPFETLPIIYERAYGGGGSNINMRNPIGVGHEGARPLDLSIDTEVPNIEYPDGRSEPAGFGIIARQWQPRLALAGTYDQTWLSDRCPLLPVDFKPTHHQAAPLDQQSDKIFGGEHIELRNMTPEGVWQFRLPSLKIPVYVWYANREEIRTSKLDTILLEPEEYRLTLKARVKIPMVRNQPPLRQVILGQISPGWWRSRLRGKGYSDPLGLKGRRRNAMDYEA